ncbi:MAG: hypothetical protein AAF762_15480, partial [Pseudomonadota bacterium]
SDSRLLLTTGGRDSVVAVWEAQTGQQLYQRQTPLGCLFVPVYGAPDGAVYYLEEGRAGVCDVPRTLHRFDGQTSEPVVDLSQVGPLFLDAGGRIDASGTRLLLTNETFGVVVVGLDGTRLANLPASLTGGEFGEFARGGNAIALPFYHSETAAGVNLYGYDGQPIEAESDDLLPFLHGVYTPGGVAIGWAARAGNDYVGADVPRGLDLYQAVWDWLPEEMRADIDADRVIRP